MTNFEKITEMWSRARQTIVAPQGFKEACEDYIDSVMRDKLKTAVFPITDDKYCTGVKTIEISPMMTGKGNCKLIFRMEGGDRWLVRHNLDDQTMHSLAKTIMEYEVAEITLIGWEEGGLPRTPVRKVLDLGVTLNLSDPQGECRIDDNGFYLVGADTLYQESDDSILDFFALSYWKIETLADKVLQGNGGEEFFRAVAERYLRRALQEETNADVWEFPFGSKSLNVSRDTEDDWIMEGAVMVNFHLDGDLSVKACYDNGLVEGMDEMNIATLWDLVYRVEYDRHLHYEDVWNKTYDLTDSNEYGKVAEEYIHRVVYSLRKSSRWFGFTKQRLMLMDKGQTPFGFFRDIVCKNGKVEVEYFTCGEDDYFDLLFDAEPVEGCIKTCDFSRLSPVSMKHLVHLIGYGSGDDEDVREDYRHILFHEVWDDIVGVRVPYRIVDGKRVTTERIHDDAEMLEVARRKGIDHEVADCWFWQRTCPAEKIRELAY